MRDIARQLRMDFGRVPGLVDEYVVHTPRREAIKSSRQVCGVTHYLSLMSGVEPDPHKCAMYGVTVTCIDEVTDMLGEQLHPGPINQALMGNPPFESLRAVTDCSRLAEDERFDHAVSQIGHAQDQSRHQFGDIPPDKVERVTRRKGGWSARANLALLKSDISDPEWDFIYRFGFLMQMLDDYLDQPKDRENGLKTPYMYGFWDHEKLDCLADLIADEARGVWDNEKAMRRFFAICRLHRSLGRVENETRLRASWLAPGYL